MALTNKQFDSIMRIYDQLRLENAAIARDRYAEVVKDCPQIEAIDKQIVKLSFQEAVQRIGGDTGKSDSESDSHSSVLHASGPSLDEQLDELAERKAMYLENLGKPADYLEPIYSCPFCHDTGYIGQEKCTCFKRYAIDLVYHDSNLKNITATENFDRFSYEWYSNDSKDIDAATKLTPYMNMKRIVDACQDFIADFDAPDRVQPNLLFYGTTGVGKTFLSNCIARELLNTSHSVIYLTAVEFFKKLSDNAFADARDKDKTDTSFIVDCDFLIIDDLGTELSNKFTTSRLFYILNERILRNRSTLISTNLTLNQLRDQYSERVSSRIIQSYQIFKFYGADIRIQQKRRNS